MVYVIILYWVFRGYIHITQQKDTPIGALKISLFYTFQPFI